MRQSITFLSLPSFSFLLFIFFFVNSTTIAFPLTNETDHQALLAIKDMIPGDPFHVFSTWNDSIHFCEWQGVGCGRKHQRVTALNLSSRGLAGSLSPHIGNLTFLRIIDLGNNTFHGTIPQHIGSLFRLQSLKLYSNFFQGELPSNLTHCLHIRIMDLNSNKLQGRIPPELGSLSNLFRLSVRYNELTGTIPPSLGNLSNLGELTLAHNSLEGSIPFELVLFSKLESFSLAFNQLSGEVPTSLYNISSLNFFSVSFNLLQGSLPPDLGLNLPKLQGLYVAANQFSGPIPSSIGNASKLFEIDISKNLFTGPLPMTMGNLHDLQKLICFSNKLGVGGIEGNELMNFFNSISNCSNLQFLDLAANLFQGLLPNSIANISTTTTLLALDDNYLFGSIPVGIGNLVNLSTLALHFNMLTGSIPDSIGKIYMLEKLILNSNNISGEIPFSIGNLSRLGILTLMGNVIEGSIPSSLGNCTNLNGIHLGFNQLTGTIPPQIFGLPSLDVLFLNQNYLTGELPLEVGKLRNLGKLHISDNKLSGEIPVTLGSCQVLEFLYMQGNLFKGTIPPSFQQLKGIQLLDVSLNNLSGKIPKFLGELHFQYLNLSYNMFDGEVPKEGVFENVSAFSIVGNNKLCGGVNVLQLPACPTEVLKGKKLHFNSRVITLVVTLSIVLLLACLSTILYRIRRSKQQASSALPSEKHDSQLSYGELLQATNGFSSDNLIGEGRYSSVYKGILESGEKIVAVKVLNLNERGAGKSFLAECEAVRNIRHRNLVKIITSCSSIDFRGNDFKALVFEFMANGSLESWLHPTLSEQHDPKKLNFVQRLNIAIDVAAALDYLHHDCEMTFIHCDIKPSNILLDDDLCAHVGDFGLARIISAATGISYNHQSSSMGIKGTVGYVAPEYGMGEALSTQGDMYSYGVLLLEMFTGKRPTDSMLSGDIDLHNYTKMSLLGRIMEIVDPQVIVEEEELPNTSNKLEVSLVSILQIGVSCSAGLPSERMNARDVLNELHKIRKAYLSVGGQGDKGLEMIPSHVEAHL
ncbi:probable LRR receptor-like serine/threonine-protein kinase At3g47570 [Actinidia eriantha]|uniref:probable LRR receptor-like serine/threonine-protein kinase At3g47570 n=1 Tax=Actinidia eriantha TaxID=165200 RepID=UPI00258B5A78|nr:probable LRR receptor-like serine/threonine-protein kinase At3g47570 [Actinidia eriantha]